MSEEPQPDPITFTDHVFDFSFHPSNNIVAVGLINGLVQCHNYSAIDPNTLVWSTQVSKKSCRGVEFTNDGSHLMSISRDKSIQALDVATGRLLYKIPKAHKHAINKIRKLDTHLTATGDDEGVVKIWDMRTCKAIQEYKVHEDFIADINYCKSKSSLLVAGGDGLLSIHDLRKPIEKIKITDEIDDELLSMTVVKDGERVIAGSQSGALYMWDWNKWDSATKWIGHPSSVDSICKLDENAICTGGSDGLLRLISISPQNFEGILGDHGQDFPIECVKLNHDDKFLASCGHDLQLRFWNVQFLFDKEEEEQEDDKEDDDAILLEEQKDGLSGTSSRRKLEDDTQVDEPLHKRPKKTRGHGQFFKNL